MISLVCAVADPGFQIRGGPGQVHSLNSKNIYAKFSKYFYKNNAEIKTQYNCSVILKFQNCNVQISHKSYAGSSLRGFISSIRLGFFASKYINNFTNINRYVFMNKQKYQSIQSFFRHCGTKRIFNKF